MSSTKYSGRVVVITGASSGIGRCSAVAFAERGASVVLAARDESSLKAAAEACEQAGVRALAVPTDVSDEHSVEQLARRAHEEFGRIDVWVNGAAVIVFGEFEHTPSRTYHQALETNLMGQIHGSRAVLPYFRERGAGVLINIGSVWATVTSPYVSAYVVSKFGVRAFSESLQQALRLQRATKKVRVCTILPQSVDTPIFRHAANYTGKRAKPVPPVVDTRRVVFAILRSVDHPRRQRTVGNWGRLLEVGHAVAPGLLSTIVPTVMNHAALGRADMPPTDGNVFEPMPDWNRPHGNWRNVPLRIGIGAATGTIAAGIAGWARWRRPSEHGSRSTARKESRWL